MEEPAAAGAADHGTEAEAGSSWVVDMQRMLEDTDPSVERERWNKNSIYRVPQWIKDMNINSKAYKPSMVSLGPLHHGDPDLQPMEEHKRRALRCLVKRSRKPLREFVDAVEEVAEQLRDAYEERREENNFVELMVTDGCFLLEAMRMDSLFGVEEEDDDGRVEVDYDPNDPIFSKHGYLYMWSAIRSDMIRMENQLPLLLLQKLRAVESGTSPDDREINKMVLGFLDLPAMVDINRLGLHPLDIFHRSFTVGARPDITMSATEDFTMLSAQKLHEWGINFESHTDSLLNVRFELGVLSMPEITVDDDTEIQFLNLMAFERLHVGVGNHVTAYVAFMDEIINTTRDVELLQKERVIKNLLGSEEEVAKLFNTLNKGTVISEFSVLHDVKRQVDDHGRKRRNRWRASFKQNYCSSPWVFISLVAAAILLVATLLQTVYTMVSFYRN